MSVVKVKIAEVKSIQDQTGKSGPQKRIVIREALENGYRTISGWVALKDFDPSVWVSGKCLELDVFKSKDGKFWNFKTVSGKARENHEHHEEVMGALRLIFKKLNQIEVKLTTSANKSDGLTSESHDDFFASEPDFSFP